MKTQNKQKNFIVKRESIIREALNDYLKWDISKDKNREIKQTLKDLDSLTAEQLLNETETEPFTIEERTDLNINKVTHDKVKRSNK